jgi:Holliday junction resolvase RusA-like endonuclease
MIELNIILPGSIRSKKNSKRIFSQGRFKRVLPSAAYCEWEKQARASLVYVDPFPYKNLIQVNAQIYYSGQQPDLSGCLESIGDCMEGIIWENDKQIISWDGSRLHHDLKNPRTELIIQIME